jgi:hypothetical protein
MWFELPCMQEFSFVNRHQNADCLRKQTDRFPPFFRQRVSRLLSTVSPKSIILSALYEISRFLLNIVLSAARSVAAAVELERDNIRPDARPGSRRKMEEHNGNDGRHLTLRLRSTKIRL